MKLFKKMKDGGPESPVIGYFLIEAKSLFSIVLLNFTGTREAYHSHAFNALTLWLRGKVFEAVKQEEGVELNAWQPGDLKYTPRNLMHKVIPVKTSKGSVWALSLRGPWDKTWQEFKDGETITLGHGRVVLR